MIKLNNVSKNYITKNGSNVPALSNINLEVVRGEIFGIIGTSGAGKSTLLHLVNRLEVPDSGEVIVEGRSINKLSNYELKLARQKIGMIFQHFNLLSSYTVYDNLVFPLKINGSFKRLSTTQLKELVDPILALTGLTNFVHNYPSQLSGGQKQRVAIARSLITKPHVLLCDECTSALDPETTTAILTLLKKINLELGVTILLITHEMEVIKNICSRVAVMSHGSIVEMGNVIELFAAPKHVITKKILARSLLQKLPKVVLDSITSDQFFGYYPLMQLIFTNETAARPILSELTRAYDISFNILQGDIETIQSVIIGRLIVQLEIESEQIEQISNLFKGKKINIEILGYAPRLY